MLRTAGLIDIEDPMLSAGIVSAGVRLGAAWLRRRSMPMCRRVDLASAQFRIDELRVSAAGELATPKLSFEATAPSAMVADEQLTDIRAGGELAGNVLTIGGVTASQAGNPGRVTLAGTYNLRTRQYDASAGVTQWTVAATTERPLAVQLDAMFNGAGSVEQPHGTGSLHATQLSWNGSSVGDLLADVDLDGTAANIRARAPNLNAQVDARINVRAPYQTTADVRGDNIDLGKLIPPSLSPTPLTGRVSFTGHGDIPLAQWRDGNARLEVTAFDAAAGELPIRLAEPAYVRFADQRLWIDRFAATAGGTRISASGALPVFERSPGVNSGGISLMADGDIGEAARAFAATGLGTLPIREGSGPLVLEAHVTGSLERPVFTFRPRRRPRDDRTGGPLNRDRPPPPRASGERRP
jgi:hypothetical protein